MPEICSIQIPIYTNDVREEIGINAAKNDIFGEIKQKQVSSLIDEAREKYFV